jgi:hypothetical protein
MASNIYIADALKVVTDTLTLLLVAAWLIPEWKDSSIRGWRVWL